MKTIVRPVARLISLALVATAVGGSAWATPPAKGGDAAHEKKAGAAAALDPKAMSLLKSMSTFLGEKTQFAVHSDGDTEVVRENGEKIAFDHSTQVWVKRPSALRSDRRGDKVSAEFYYDGKTFTLFGRQHSYYATAPAPPTLDLAIDAAREKLGLDTGVGDLLYSNSYDALTEDLISATYVGTSDIHGTRCHHLAFRGTQTDWEIWIEDGKDPIPRKFAISSKKVKSAPEYRTELSQWNFNPDINDALFHFVPPPDAKRIDFQTQTDKKAKTSKGGSK